MHAAKIERAFLTVGTDKAKVHGYHSHYSRIFSGVQPRSILEIGIKQGRSLAAWRLLFPNAKIVGVDITDSLFEEEFIDFAVADVVLQDSTKKEIRDVVQAYDLIVDDGSHYYKDIMQTFANLSDRFTHAYVIEDVMYGLDDILEQVRSLGYTKIEVHDSKVKDVEVETWWLLDPKGKARPKQTKRVSLQMVVVYK